MSLLPEIYFPKCINEKSALAMLEKERLAQRDGQELLDEDVKNQHITSWSNSQTSSEPQTPSPPGKCRRPNNDIGRELEAFE